MGAGRGQPDPVAVGREEGGKRGPAELVAVLEGGRERGQLDARAVTCAAELCAVVLLLVVLVGDEAVCCGGDQL